MSERVKLTKVDFAKAVFGGAMLNAMVMSALGTRGEWTALASGGALVAICLASEVQWTKDRSLSDEVSRAVEVGGGKGSSVARVDMTPPSGASDSQQILGKEEQ